jgi:hypothetical protein
LVGRTRERAPLASIRNLRIPTLDESGFVTQAAGGTEGARERRVEDEESDMRKKRDLFGELVEGFDALADQRAGKGRCARMC